MGDGISQTGINRCKQGMKKVIFVFIFFLYLVCRIDCIGQNFGCPLVEGKVLVQDSGSYSHSNPAYSTTIESFKEDSVRSSLHGLVLDVIKLSEIHYTVIIKTGEITIAYRNLRSATVKKHENVELGSCIGKAQKSENDNYLIDVTIWIGKEAEDASKLLPCTKNKS